MFYCFSAYFVKLRDFKSNFDKTDRLLKIACHSSTYCYCFNLTANQANSGKLRANTVRPEETHKHVYTISRLTLSGQSALISLSLISSPALTRWEVEHIIPGGFPFYRVWTINTKTNVMTVTEIIIYYPKQNVTS